MTQLSLEPFFLLDQNLSYRFAPAFDALGFRMTSVHEAFPGQVSVPDQDQIIWLSDRGKQNAVWITADEDAQKAHAKLIAANDISALWIHWSPKGEKGLADLRLLTMVIPDVRDSVARATRPVYFRASWNVRRPKLERLQGTLLVKKLKWHRLQLST